MENNNLTITLSVIVIAFPVIVIVSIVRSRWAASSLEIPVLNLRYVTCVISCLNSVEKRPSREILHLESQRRPFVS